MLLKIGIIIVYTLIIICLQFLSNSETEKIDENTKISVSELDKNCDSMIGKIAAAYNKFWDNKFTMVMDDIKTNKVDDNTCDVRFKYTGDSEGTDYRQFRMTDPIYVDEYHTGTSLSVI